MNNAPLKAVIVDDEKDSREILAAYVKKYCSDVVICDFADSVDSGLKAIAAHHPDIVFLDIEMPYGNGFDLLDKAPAIDFETVFVTAFDHYAMQALNQSAAYYLLKPIDIDELVKAVEKIQRERNAEHYMRHVQVLQGNLKAAGRQHEKMMLPTMEGFEIVGVRSILYCEAEDNFTKFYFEDRQPLLICRTLKYFEDLLRDHSFVRIHRSYLINPDFVIRYSKGKGGYVTMKNAQELEVSPNRKKEFLDAFGK